MSVMIPSPIETEPPTGRRLNCEKRTGIIETNADLTVAPREKETAEMAALIIIVDDEPDIRDLTGIHLKKAGYEVAAFAKAEPFLAFIARRQPDLIILDLMLPDADGLDVCKYLKRDDRFSGIPVIMLTAKREETDRILGLELGADDYVTKPFSPRELVARVKAVLRRDQRTDASGLIRIGKRLVIDPGRHAVSVDGKSVSLTATEFRILHLLASRKGWVFSRDQILDHLWGQEKAVLDRTVDVHIKHLREKLGREAARLIKNVRGIGYKVEE
jgi:two-component system phosphate regulon response regulator PhoB/two-component system alkaline phosphatase synthesis response regulator PhoP